MAEVKEQPKAPFSADELGRAIAEGLREAQRNPDRERQLEAARQRLRIQQEADQQVKRIREQSCAHLREDGTCCIAWMENSDGITRGVCQRCNTCFDPNHARYAELRRIPTRTAGIVW